MTTGREPDRDEWLYVDPEGDHPSMEVIQLEKVVQNVSLRWLKWPVALFLPWKAFKSPALLVTLEFPLYSSLQTKAACAITLTFGSTNINAVDQLKNP